MAIFKKAKPKDRNKLFLFIFIVLALLSLVIYVGASFKLFSVVSFGGAGQFDITFICDQVSKNPITCTYNLQMIGPMERIGNLFDRGLDLTNPNVAINLGFFSESDSVLLLDDTIRLPYQNYQKNNPNGCNSHYFFYPTSGLDIRNWVTNGWVDGTTPISPSFSTPAGNRFGRPIGVGGCPPSGERDNYWWEPVYKKTISISIPQTWNTPEVIKSGANITIDLLASFNTPHPYYTSSDLNTPATYTPDVLNAGKVASVTIPNPYNSIAYTTQQAIDNFSGQGNSQSDVSSLVQNQTGYKIQDEATVSFKAPSWIDNNKEILSGSILALAIIFFIIWYFALL